MDITPGVIQPATRDQVMQANQFGVAGMYGQALVRRAVGMGRAERQGLPDSETAGSEEIDIAQRLPAEFPVPGLPGTEPRALFPRPQD